MTNATNNGLTNITDTLAAMDHWGAIRDAQRGQEATEAHIAYFESSEAERLLSAASIADALAEGQRQLDRFRAEEARHYAAFRSFFR